MMVLPLRSTSKRMPCDKTTSRESFSIVTQRQPLSTAMIEPSALSSGRVLRAGRNRRCDGVGTKSNGMICSFTYAYNACVSGYCFDDPARMPKYRLQAAAGQTICSHRTHAE